MALAAVFQEFSDEIEDIRECFHQDSSPKLVRNSMMEYRPVSDGCIISLWDAWSRFMRNLILTSASGPVVGRGGTQWSPAIVRSEAAVLSFLRARKQSGAAYQLYRGEPIWHSVSDTWHIADALQLQNASILAAVGAGAIDVAPGMTVPSPVPEVRHFRNYIAHKTNSNKAVVLNYCSATASSSMEAHLRATTTGGSTPFDDWLDGFLALSDVATS